MNRRVCFLCVLALSGKISWASNTFLTLPVPFLPSSIQRQTLTHDQLREYDVQPWHNFSVTLFGTQTNDSDKIARYFLPNEQTSIRVGELGSEMVNNHSVDVIANYFDILTGDRIETGQIFNTVNTWTFESNVSFCPKQTICGMGLLYHQHLSQHRDRGFWLELAMPIMAIRNDLHMCEWTMTPGGPNGDDPQTAPSFFVDKVNAYHNMTAAFKSSHFKYGKIDCNVYREFKIGVPHLEIGGGYTYFRRSAYHLSSYIGALIATGNTPDARYLFETVVGNNGKTGFFLGSQGGIKVWEHGTNFLTFDFESMWAVYLPNNQIRSIDLRGKPWGRYIWVYTGPCTTASMKPGINSMTKTVSVAHVSTLDLNLASVYNTEHFQCEFGFHTYVRSHEKVCLARSVCGSPALAALWYNNDDFILPASQKASRSNATINSFRDVINDVKNFEKQGPGTGNDAYLPINNCQFDLDSATCPAITMGTIYAGIGYGWYNARCPVVIGIGGGYEFGDGNASVDRMHLWGKLSVAF